MNFTDKIPTGMALYPDNVYNLTKWRDFNMTIHKHGNIEFNYVIEGSCIYKVDGRNILLKKKEVIILDSSVPHQVIVSESETKKPCSIIGASLYFDKATPGILPTSELVANNKIISTFFESFKDYIVLQNSSSIYHTLRSILDECEVSYDKIYCNILLNKLLFEVSRISQGTGHATTVYVEDMKKFINENYNKINCIDDIANHVCLNKVYLQRIFKKAVGRTIWQYVNEVRMKRAVYLLKNSDLSIGDIDSAVGINSRQTFYLLFKKFYGMSPSEYRNFSTDEDYDFKLYS